MWTYKLVMKKIILTIFGCLVAINFAIAYTGITFTDIAMPQSGGFHLKLEMQQSEKTHYLGRL